MNAIRFEHAVNKISRPNADQNTLWRQYQSQTKNTYHWVLDQKQESKLYSRPHCTFSNFLRKCSKLSTVHVVWLAHFHHDLWLTWPQSCCPQTVHWLTAVRQNWNWQQSHDAEIRESFQYSPASLCWDQVPQHPSGAVQQTHDPDSHPPHGGETD